MTTETLKLHRSSAAGITLLVLTLNEIDGVAAIMPQLQHELFDQIIIVDGGSTDGTIEWAHEKGYEVYVQKKKGIRHAYLEVLPLIKGDVILSFSPDGNCPPRAIPLILDKIGEGYDLVIGSRYLGDAVSEDDDAVTSFGNWLFTRTVNILHRASYSDAMVIFRAFRKSLVYELDLDREESYILPERLFGTVISWEPLMSVRAAKARKRITEIAVGEPPRIGGKRKLQILRWGAAYYFQFWREMWYWRPKPQTARSALPAADARKPILRQVRKSARK
jgi:glycosyltransferase involved in cell wall biosynthesis